jgi:hypothetical protein
VKQERDEATEMLSALRIRLVAYSKSDYKAFMEYLKENEDVFKYHIDNESKEQLRKMCQDAWERFSRESKLSDTELFDDIFGFLIPNSMPCVQGQPKIPRIEREMDYFARSTYSAFYKWLSHPNTLREIMRHSELRDKLSKIIDRQRKENKVVGNGKGYEPSDEDLFSRFIG